MPHAERARRDFADEGKGRRCHVVVQALAKKPFPHFSHPFHELLGSKPGQIGAGPVYLVDELTGAAARPGPAAVQRAHRPMGSVIEPA